MTPTVGTAGVVGAGTGAAAGGTVAGAPARVATAELVRQLVRELRGAMAGRLHPEPFIVGIKATPVWNLGDLDDPAVGTISVQACQSPLAVRRAIAEFDQTAAGDPNATLVVLTDVAEGVLGADVLGRFVRPKLYGLSPWDAVRQRFGVRTLDPAFGDSRFSWMADPLLDVPVESLPAGAVVLSADAALRALASAILGASGITLERLILATTSTTFASDLDAADPTVVAALCSTLGELLGPAGQLVTGAIAQGRGETCLPAGLAARTVVGATSASMAQARIEDLTGCRSVTDSALQAWAEAAEAAFAEIAERSGPGASGGLGASAGLGASGVTHADLYQLEATGSALVGEWQAPAPDASNVLNVSFEARLDQLAVLLDAALGDPASTDPASKAGGASQVGGVAADTLRQAVQRVVTHRLSATPAGRPRAQRAQLAARLVSWLADPISARHGTGVGSNPNSPVLTLAESIEAYRADGAWVDAARRRVGEGDDTPPRFADALKRISAAAHQRRADGNRAFAEALARWSVDGTAAELPATEVVAVEAVLGQVIAPLANHAAILLIVLDGCGLAPFLELADQFAQFGLKEISPTDQRRVALAALPTVTEASRTSLLAGTLRTGAAADETRELPKHPKIAKLDGPGAVLWHQRPDFGGGIGQSLPAPVRDSLGENGPRVVAAVINTIDDQLSRGTFTPEYRLEHLDLLPGLLRDATNAGRIVVITADHGHVLGVGLDGRGEVERSGEGGDRWRIADREPSADEVLLRGPRVLLGDDRGVLAPYHDDLRYSAKHGGYHGGATPDECIVPLSVYAPAGIELPKGWDLLSVATPTWWDLHVDVVEEAKKSTAAKRPAKKTPKASAGQGALFEPALDSALDSASAPDAGSAAGSVGGAGAGEGATGNVPAWVDEVLASDVYALQLGAISRVKPADDKVRSALAAIHRRGGVANYAVLAQATGMPGARVAGFVVVLSRLLNVDGFGVLTVDTTAREVRLDENLLRSQFLQGAP
ncbi:MAG: BREX-2 system phosphatase PglZ [Microthrixaceae bacterium]